MMISHPKNKIAPGNALSERFFINPAYLKPIRKFTMSLQFDFYDFRIDT